MATFNFEEAEKKLQPTAAPSFNFEEAEQALAKVPVSRPTPQQIERQSGAALIKPVQSTFAPYSVDETGAAFGVFVQTWQCRFWFEARIWQLAYVAELLLRQSNACELLKFHHRHSFY
jgi:hypothetical protein